MCAACIEYMKDKLTTQEFRSALKEAAREDQRHQGQVEELISTHSEKPEELKELLKPLSRESKDY